MQMGLRRPSTDTGLAVAPSLEYRVPLVDCEGIAVAFGANTIFTGVDLRIENRDRLAVVGANGAGKTPLLNVIAGLMTPSAGVIERARGLRIGYLPQDAPEPIAASVLDEVMASRADLVAMHEEMSALEHTMSAPSSNLPAVMERYGSLQHAYQDAGGYDLETRARITLAALHLGEELARHPTELSGGQQRRL